MASSRIVARLSSRLQPFALKLSSQNTSVLSNNSSLLKSASQSAINRRLSLISRLPVELSSLETMMPLHSAIASARLQSSLSLESQTWGLVPQVFSDVGDCKLSCIVVPVSDWLRHVTTMKRYLNAFIVLSKTLLGQGFISDQ
ncbi:hypothetical protein Sango_1536900 [Sesamum angolense]|uniref:Uncharacterized protein n=1 Tax=Sesamum angolense TaxID=2727404 RepID=A0AAE1WPQ8_9LAMI|nr:hypothetical protein Sango_1536900 [Sesamum angolense]